jgi:hypothetical protein
MIPPKGIGPDDGEGLARALTALRLGLELLGDMATSGAPPGLDAYALAETIEVVVRRVVNASELLLGNSVAA